MNQMTTNASEATRTLLRTEGFSCPSCVAKIEKQLGRVAGVNRVKVHFASGRIEVDHDHAQVSAEELARAISAMGYPASPAAF